MTKPREPRIPARLLRLGRSGGRPLAARKRQRDLFLAALLETGSVTRAARRAGISRSAAYAEAERSKEFAADWDAMILLHRQRHADAAAALIEALAGKAPEAAGEQWPDGVGPDPFA